MAEQEQVLGLKQGSPLAKAVFQSVLGGLVIFVAWLYLVHLTDQGSVTRVHDWLRGVLIADRTHNGVVAIWRGFWMFLAVCMALNVVGAIAVLCQRNVRKGLPVAALVLGLPLLIIIGSLTSIYWSDFSAAACAARATAGIGFC